MNVNVARQSRIGLQAMSVPPPPWDFRKFACMRATENGLLPSRPASRLLARQSYSNRSNDLT